ncbi:DNA-binding response regulator [Paenibacillus ferrarius]|uniref:DNA-binding response regulator n=1 Tax=Paenibacillus ferrarius TaxID=1469647 RepID=A0A1V4HGW1_9BACL|nr:response regulator [Paenibacillus ferrarius]OPH55984.1 DNA-binding response regulator [Paenibacillus ferrarius]
MYRVLIVDDEKEIREGLRLKFPWADFGVDHVDTAEDGDIALRKVMEQRPDLILSDIKMNRMSGLAFIGQVNEKYGNSCKTVVVSGYDDFDLVRQAVQLGAMDYILKPIHIEELNKVVIKALNQVQNERNDEHNRQLLENQLQLAIPKLQEEIMREVTGKPYNPNWQTQMGHRLKSVELDWILQEPLALMVIEVDDLKSIELGRAYRNEKELILFSIGNVVDQTCEEEYQYPYTLFMDEKCRWVIVYNCANRDLESVKETAKTCIERINRYVKVNVSIGLHSNIGTVESLFHMLQKTGDILEQKAVYGGNRILIDEEIGVDAEFSEMPLSDTDLIFDVIQYASESEISLALNGFNEMVRSWPAAHIKDIQQCLFEWLLELFKKAAHIGLKDLEWERNPIAIWERLEKYDTLESLRNQVEVFLLELSRSLKQLSKPQNQIITEAMKYMNRHYADNLTLQGVASEVHVTPVWLSKLFKKEIHQTFLEFLTSLRIEKAKEMLGDVRYKIYQVSQEVGYRDPVHFSKLFRKSVGHTPKEYRKIRGIQDE